MQADHGSDAAAVKVRYVDGERVATYKVPTQNMKPTATLRYRFMFSLRTQDNGNKTRTTSCAIAEAEFAYARALMSKHLPSTSLFQNASTGRQEKMVSRKMSAVLTMIQMRMM